MRRLFLPAVALCVCLFAGCGAPAENKPAYTTANANAAKPAAGSAPTLEQLVAMDRQANEAWGKSNGGFFNEMLSEKFFMVVDGKRMNKADMIKMVNDAKCDIKSSEMSEPKMMRLDDDTYLLTYKAVFDGSCMGEKVPSPVRAASLYVRGTGDKWQGLYHGETPIVEQKAASSGTSNAAPADNKKAADQAGKTSPAGTANSSAPPMKPEAEMSESVANQSNAITNALTTVETAAWEAWRIKDGAKFEQISAADVTFIDPMGGIATSKAEALKMWTDAGCQIASTRISDNDGMLITDKLAALHYKGTAVGTCGGQKMKPVWGTTFFVKDGQNWKAAFMIETPV